MRNIMTKTKLSEKLFIIFTYSKIVFFALFCIIPFWIVIINSFADESEIQSKGIQFLPHKYSLSAYQYILAGEQVLRSYTVTITVTVLGTLLAVIITSMLAYVISNYKAKYGKIISFILIFTMIFGSGLVGFYIMVANWLNLKDTIWALILPYLVNPFFTMILVSFMKTIPKEINESATVDGANEILIFFKIIFPISIPGIATISLFYALQYWNDWWLALLFIDNYKLHPLQLMIRQFMANINIAAYVAGSGTNYRVNVPNQSMQMAIVCLTIGPVILLYPYIQKYFIKGITLGAVKG